MDEGQLAEPKANPGGDHCGGRGAKPVCQRREQRPPLEILGHGHREVGERRQPPGKAGGEQGIALVGESVPLTEQAADQQGTKHVQADDDELL